MNIKKSALYLVGGLYFLFFSAACVCNGPGTAQVSQKEQQSAPAAASAPAGEDVLVDEGTVVEGASAGAVSADEGVVVEESSSEAVSGGDEGVVVEESSSEVVSGDAGVVVEEGSTGVVSGDEGVVVEESSVIEDGSVPADGTPVPAN